MNAFPQVCPPADARAFTLVEVLVSAAVLVLMILLVAQLVSGATNVIGHSGRHMSSDTESRLLFNRMAVDMSRMVKRTDVDESSFKMAVSGSLSAVYGSAVIPANVQPGNDQMAFYAETDGYYSGVTQPGGSQRAPVSLIAYTVANDPYTNLPGLRRMAKGMGWDPDSGGAWGTAALLPITLLTRWPDLFGSDPDYKTVASQVFRFEYSYLIKPSSTQGAHLSTTPWNPALTPAHTCPNGFKDVAGILVAIAVLDTTSRVLLSGSSAYSSLAAALPDAQDSSTDTTYKGDIASAWNAQVNSATFATTAGIPLPAAAGVRVYERYFYLDTPQ